MFKSNNNKNNSMVGLPPENGLQRKANNELGAFSMEVLHKSSKYIEPKKKKKKQRALEASGGSSSSPAEQQQGRNPRKRLQEDEGSFLMKPRVMMGIVVLVIATVALGLGIYLTSSDTSEGNGDGGEPVGGGDGDFFGIEVVVEYYVLEPCGSYNLDCTLSDGYVPYNGLELVDGIPHFVDKVRYSQIYSQETNLWDLKLEVIYGHDELNQFENTTRISTSILRVTPNASSIVKSYMYDTVDGVNYDCGRTNTYSFYVKAFMEDPLSVVPTGGNYSNTDDVSASSAAAAARGDFVHQEKDTFGVNTIYQPKQIYSQQSTVLINLVNDTNNLEKIRKLVIDEIAANSDNPVENSFLTKQYDVFAKEGRVTTQISGAGAYQFILRPYNAEDHNGKTLFGESLTSVLLEEREKTTKKKFDLKDTCLEYETKVSFLKTNVTLDEDDFEQCVPEEEDNVQLCSNFFEGNYDLKFGQNQSNTGFKVVELCDAFPVISRNCKCTCTNGVYELKYESNDDDINNNNNNNNPNSSLRPAGFRLRDRIEKRRNNFHNVPGLIAYKVDNKADGWTKTVKNKCHRYGHDPASINRFEEVGRELTFLDDSGRKLDPQPTLPVGTKLWFVHPLFFFPKRIGKIGPNEFNFDLKSKLCVLGDLSEVCLADYVICDGDSDYVFGSTTSNGNTLARFQPIKDKLKLNPELGVTDPPPNDPPKPGWKPESEDGVVEPELSNITSIFGTGEFLSRNRRALKSQKENCNENGKIIVEDCCFEQENVLRVCYNKKQIHCSEEDTVTRCLTKEEYKIYQHEEESFGRMHVLFPNNDGAAFGEKFAKTNNGRSRRNLATEDDDDITPVETAPPVDPEDCQKQPTIREKLECIRLKFRSQLNLNIELYEDTKRELRSRLSTEVGSIAINNTKIPKGDLAQFYLWRLTELEHNNTLRDSLETHMGILETYVALTLKVDTSLSPVQSHLIRLEFFIELLTSASALIEEIIKSGFVLWKNKNIKQVVEAFVIPLRALYKKFIQPARYFVNNEPNFEQLSSLQDVIHDILESNERVATTMVRNLALSEHLIDPALAVVQNCKQKTDNNAKVTEYVKVLNKKLVDPFHNENSTLNVLLSFVSKIVDLSDKKRDEIRESSETLSAINEQLAALIFKKGPNDGPTLFKIYSRFQKILDIKMKLFVPVFDKLTQRMEIETQVPCDTKICEWKTPLNPQFQTNNSTVKYPCGVILCKRKVSVTTKRPRLQYLEIKAGDIVEGISGLSDTILFPLMKSFQIYTIGSYDTNSRFFNRQNTVLNSLRTFRDSKLDEFIEIIHSLRSFTKADIKKAIRFPIHLVGEPPIRDDIAQNEVLDLAYEKCGLQDLSVNADESSRVFWQSIDLNAQNKTEEDCPWQPYLGKEENLKCEDNLIDLLCKIPFARENPTLIPTVNFLPFNLQNFTNSFPFTTYNSLGDKEFIYANNLTLELTKLTSPDSNDTYTMVEHDGQGPLPQFAPNTGNESVIPPCFWANEYEINIPSEIAINTFMYTREYRYFSKKAYTEYSLGPTGTFDSDLNPLLKQSLYTGVKETPKVVRYNFFLTGGVLIADYSQTPDRAITIAHDGTSEQINIWYYSPTLENSFEQPLI